MNDQLNIDNFHAKTGFRFRVSREQNLQIKAGKLTREEAFNQFIASGGIANLKTRKPNIPDSVYLEDGLTLENFSERVKAATGTERRFRMSREQGLRVKAGSLTREQALQEVIELVKTGQSAPVTE